MWTGGLLPLSFTMKASIVVRRPQRKGFFCVRGPNRVWSCGEGKHYVLDGGAATMTGPGPVAWFAPVLGGLLDGRNLTTAEMERTMEGVLAGECGDAELAGLLVALRMKGETGE